MSYMTRLNHGKTPRYSTTSHGWELGTSWCPLSAPTPPHPHYHHHATPSPQGTMPPLWVAVAFVSTAAAAQPIQHSLIELGCYPSTVVLDLYSNGVKPLTPGGCNAVCEKRVGPGAYSFIGVRFVKDPVTDPQEYLMCRCGDVHPGPNPALVCNYECEYNGEKYACGGPGTVSIYLDMAQTPVPTLAPPTPLPTVPPPTSEPTLIPPTSEPTLMPPTSEPTVAPPTIAPTQVPPTKPPATLPPDTVTPPTLAPTLSPPTYPPQVLPVPPTASLVPTTPTPSTSPGIQTATPFTMSPFVTEGPASFNVTAVPVEETLAPVVEEQVNVTEPMELSISPVVSDLASVGAVLSMGPGAGPALRLLAASAACELDGETQKVSRFLHPTQWYPDHSEAVGMVVGNIGICVCVALMCFLAHYPVMIVAPKLLPKFFHANFDYIGFLRFPSVPLFVFLFLYQGMSLGTLLLVLHSDVFGLKVLGVAGVCVCMVVPLALSNHLRTGVPSKGVYVLDDERSGWFKRMIIGPGEWCSIDMKCDWANRYTGQLRYYKQKYSYFIGFNFVSAFFVSCCLAVKPSNMKGCGHVKLSLSLIAVAELILEVTFWPHVRSVGNAADFTVLSMQAVGMALFAIGYYTEDKTHWSFDMASQIISVAFMFIALKLILDLITELYVFCSGRRDRLQELLIERGVDTTVELLEAVPSKRGKVFEYENVDSDCDIPEALDIEMNGTSRSSHAVSPHIGTTSPESSAAYLTTETAYRPPVSPDPSEVLEDPGLDHLSTFSLGRPKSSSGARGLRGMQQLHVVSPSESEERKVSPRLTSAIPKSPNESFGDLNITVSSFGAQKKLVVQQRRASPIESAGNKSSSDDDNASTVKSLKAVQLPPRRKTVPKGLTRHSTEPTVGSTGGSPLTRAGALASITSSRSIKVRQNSVTSMSSWQGLGKHNGVVTQDQPVMSSMARRDSLTSKGSGIMFRQ